MVSIKDNELVSQSSNGFQNDQSGFQVRCIKCGVQEGKQYVTYQFEISSPAGITFEICDRYSNIENYMKGLKSTLGTRH